MGLKGWETFLADHIEGFFNKKFGSELEPAELARQVGRELARRKKKTRHGAIVPNEYTIALNTDDYQRLCARRVTDGIYEAIEKEVIAKDLFMDGELKIILQKKAEFGPGTCQVRARYTAKEPEGSLPPGDEPNTIVLVKNNFKPPLNLPTEYKTVSLTVIEGPDADACLEFGEKQIFIGRRDKNDFILTDENASRLHAYIRYERHRHVIYDAQSLNGTYINGQEVKSRLLLTGDEIRLGNTVLRYEVI